MGWNEISKIVLGILVSIGGIGVIILAIIKFSANIIAKRLEDKYTFKLNKNLEKYKSSLDNKIYISKTKFDTEFSIYRELSKTFFEMVKNISIMIPSGYTKIPANKDVRKEYEDKSYSNASRSVVSAQDALNSNAPFIPENFFEKYNELLRLSRMQLSAFEKRWDVLYAALQSEKENLGNDDYQRTDEINKKLRELNICIREYLSKLDVLD